MQPERTNAILPQESRLECAALLTTPLTIFNGHVAVLLYHHHYYYHYHYHHQFSIPDPRRTALLHCTAPAAQLLLPCGARN
jgi:hypothetical protein